MNKDEFKALFDRALETAAQNAEAKLGHTVPRKFSIEMHGLDAHPRVLEANDAFEEIYLGGDRFYRVIDLAVCGISADACRVFMRISGHAPGSFDQTWNRPPGSGPFKQILANDIKVV